MRNAVICPTCNAENTEDRGFCQQCGAAVPDSPADEAPTIHGVLAQVAEDLGGAAEGAEAADADGQMVIKGRYEVLEQVGSGRMGAVYRARDRQLLRQVAIRRFGEVLAEGSARDQWLADVRAAVRLNHLNLVEVYEANCDETGCFVAMEYVEGEDLGRRLKRDGVMETQEAVAIVRQLCGALSHAHQRGIIHADIKPSNILVNELGVPKLADFGLAAVKTELSTRSAAATEAPGHGNSGREAGDEQVDPRVDVADLAITLCQMLTGKPPSEIRPDEIVGRFRAPILRAISDDPGQRYADATSFRDALAPAGADGETAALQELRTRADEQATSSNYEEAIKTWQQVLQRWPEDAEARRRSRAFVTRRAVTESTRWWARSTTVWRRNGFPMPRRSATNLTGATWIGRIRQCCAVESGLRGTARYVRRC